MEALKSWLTVIASAALGTSLLEMLAPRGRSGLDKYVKFVSAAVILLVIITPMLEILADIDGFFDKIGIICDDENINITESDEAQKWILSETLTALKDGIKKLTREKFGLSVEVEFATEIDSDGIEIQSVTLVPPLGTPYADCREAAEFLGDYLGIEVYVKNDAERFD